MRRNQQERVHRKASVGLPDNENEDKGAWEVLRQPSNQLSSVAKKAKKKLTVKKTVPLILILELTSIQ